MFAGVKVDGAPRCLVEGPSWQASYVGLYPRKFTESHLGTSWLERRRGTLSHRYVPWQLYLCQLLRFHEEAWMDIG